MRQRSYRSPEHDRNVLGFAVIGLEAGSMYMYKAGWNINAGHLVHSTILAVFLVFVGYLLYHENVSVQKMLGILLCLAGLYVRRCEAAEERLSSLPRHDGH